MLVVLWTYISRSYFKSLSLRECEAVKDILTAVEKWVKFRLPMVDPPNEASIV